jgi:hypothetical protein
MLSPYSYLQHETGWLFALGQRLRVEYDAIVGPMPPRLIALLEQLRSVSEEIVVHGREEEGKALFGRAAKHPQAAVIHSATSLYQG